MKEPIPIDVHVSKVSEIAAAGKISPYTIRRWIETGRLASELRYGVTVIPTKEARALAKRFHKAHAELAEL